MSTGRSSALMVGTRSDTSARRSPGERTRPPACSSEGTSAAIPQPAAAMRYIGNKTKLLSFLTEKIRQLGIEPGVAHDAFSGTAAVGRALKAAGWRVHSSDLMTYSYVMQRALVV